MPKIDYTPDTPMVLTVEQMATELQISVTRAYELVNAKLIPSFRPTPGVIRIPRALLGQWVADRALEETYGHGTQPTTPASVSGKRRPRARSN